ncbi:helix-turn-helix domain-containing protein [Myxococcota bacterium]
MGKRRQKEEDPDFERFRARLGKRIAAIRQGRGLTQEDMQGYGFPTRRYQRIEAGQAITMRTAHRLCKAFRITMSELVDGTMPKRRSRRST